MSIPRELALRATDSDYRLQQTPVREIAYLRQPGIDQQSVVVTAQGHQPEVSGRALDVTIDLAAVRPGGLQVIARRGDDAIAVEIDPIAGVVTVELPPAVVERGPDGALLRRADLVPGDVQLHIILDVASIEVMGGAASITDVLVLDQTPWELTLVATDGERTIERLRVHPLDSAGADAQRPVDPEGTLTWQP
jgi:sucrose-6-phosphate hydrolase SacC (GH32 family)